MLLREFSKRTSISPQIGKPKRNDKGVANADSHAISYRVWVNELLVEGLEPRGRWLWGGNEGSR
jgi:hypothetical protein